MHVGTSELLSRHLLSSRRFHQRRPAQENRALIADDNRLIAHCGNVCSTSCARTQNSSDLINALTGHSSLVVEDPSEMIAIRKYLGLKWKERSAGIDQVKTRQMVLQRNFLGPQVLFHGDGEVSAALDCRIIGNDDRLVTVNHADAGNKTGARRLIIVHARGSESAELEERCVRVQYGIDSLADEHLAAFLVALHRGLTAPVLDCCELRAEFLDDLLHRGSVGCSCHNCGMKTMSFFAHILSDVSNDLFS